MFKGFSSCILFGLIIVLALNACNEDKSIDSNSVFRYNEYRNVTSLDPAFARNPQNIWPINQLFNGLVQLDDQLQIQSEIASNWELSTDGLTYIFNLRDDIYFHSSPLFGEAKTRAVLASDFIVDNSASFFDSLDFIKLSL